jgi:hypothetical protein
LKKGYADSKIEEHLAIPARKKNAFIENIRRLDSHQVVSHEE